MKKRLLLLALMTIVLSCGGGGGGSGSSAGGGSGSTTPIITPGTPGNAGSGGRINPGANTGTVIKWPDSSVEKRTYNQWDPHNKDRVLSGNPDLDGKYTHNGVTTNVAVGIVDTGFNTDNPDYRGMLEYKFGSGVNSRFILAYKSDNPARYEYGGLMAAEIIAGGPQSLGIARDARIVAGDASVAKGEGDYDMRPTLKMFQEMEKYHSGSIAVYSLHYGNDSMADYNSANYLNGLLGGKTLQDEYIRLTKEGRMKLFVWAAGDDEDEKSPTVEAGLPKFVPETENGWISVVGLTTSPAGSDELYTTNIAGYAPSQRANLRPDPANAPVSVDLNWNNLQPLTRAGEAANWSVSALADYVSSFAYFDTYYLGAKSSNAAAAVSGAAVLIRDKYPLMEPRLIRQLILTTAVDIGEPGVDDVFGWGFLDIEKALKGPARFDKRLIRNDFLDKDRVVVNVPNAADKWVFENDISGDAGLRKQGNGTLELTGNITYTGETWVQNGTLIAKGHTYNPPTKITLGKFVVASKVNLENDVTNEGGTFEIDGKDVVVKGNYTATPESKTAFNLGANVHVKGEVDLDGSSIEITSMKDGQAQYITKKGSETDVLTSDNAIKGSISSVETSELLDAEVTKDENSVTARLSRKNVEETVAGHEMADEMRADVAGNTETAFRALDEEIEKGNYREVEKFALSAAQIQTMALNSTNSAAVLDSLSGHIYGSAQALTFQHSQTVNRDLSNRLVMLGTLDNVGENAGLWVSGIGSKGRLKQEGFGSGNTSLFGGQAGVDRQFGDSLILGTALSYSASEVKFDRHGGKSAGDGFGLSLYGRLGRKDVPYYLQGRLGLGFITSEVERDIMLNAVDVQRAKIEHRDRVFSGYIETGYDAKMGTFTLTPFAGVSHDTVSRGGFTEENSQFGLTAPKETFSQTSGHIGLRAGKAVDWNNGSRTTFQGYVSHQTAFNDEDLSFDAAYTGLSNARFTVKGIGLSKNQTWIGLGALTEVNENFGWYINYDGKLDKKGNNNVFTTGLRFNF